MGLSRIPLISLCRAVLPRAGVLPAVGRALWRKHIGVRRDLLDPSGSAAKPPLQISLRITNRCNQRCAICGQFGSKGYMHSDEGRKFLNEVPLDAYCRLVDEVAPHRPIFYITGGEAFLYKDLIALTAYMKQKRCYVYVISNGTLLEQYTGSILDQQWELLTVSLDGPQDVHDRCRGVVGSFSKTKTGVEAFLSERRKRKNKFPYFVLCATVSGENQDSLEELFDTAAQIRPDSLVLYLSWFTSKDIAQCSSEILSGSMGIEPVTLQSYVGQNENIDPAKVEKALGRLSSKKFPFTWFHIPSIPLGRLRAYYRTPEDFLGYGPCVGPYTTMEIMPNGDMVTCRDFVDVKIGNILEAPALELWNNARARDFRLLLRKHGGVLPHCSRCCGLMGF